MRSNKKRNISLCILENELCASQTPTRSTWDPYNYITAPLEYFRNYNFISDRKMKGGSRG